jgi:uncharacterized membrane protein YfcA
MISILLLFVAGLLGGFIAGLVGIGGGIIYIFIIPQALRHFGIPEEEIAQYTIANSAFAILFASASANYVLYIKNFFFRREVLLIGISAIAASLFTLKYIVNTHLYSIKQFNLIIILLLLYMLYNTVLSAKKDYSQSLEIPSFKFPLVGIAGGCIAALSGLGGGIVIIPVLNSLLKINIKKASSISSGVIMITSFAMTLFSLWETPVHIYPVFSIGYIVFPISLTLSAGVLIASPFGVRWAGKLSSKNISYIYAAFLTFVILKKVTEMIL